MLRNGRRKLSIDVNDSYEESFIADGGKFSVFYFVFLYSQQF